MQTAKFSDDNEHIEVMKSMQTSSTSHTMEFKRESQREVVKFKEVLDASSENEGNANNTSDSTVLTYKNGKVGLTEQSPYICKLLTLSIKKVQAYITLMNAYPEIEGGLAERSSLITYEAAKSLGYRGVAARMKTDHKYRRDLVHNVCSYFSLSADAN